jgi:hypothetical protein
MNHLQQAEILLEKAMDVQELEKVRNFELNGKVTRGTRAELLQHMIATGATVTLINGKQVSLDPKNNKPVIAALHNFAKTSDPQHLSVFYKPNSKTYAPVIAVVPSQMVRLNDIEKTAELGSSGGQGGGSFQTKTQEFGQAIVLGIATAIGKNHLEAADINPRNIQAGANYVQPKPTSEVQNLKQLLEDKTWKVSLLATANALLATNLKIKGKHLYHQSSDWCKQVYKSLQTANNKHPSRPFSNPNKWNPADIWAVDPGVEPPQGETIEQLNQQLLKLFKQKKVIPISLKKTSSNPQISVHNLNAQDDKTQIMMGDLILSNSNKLETLFSSKHTYMKYESEQPLFSIDHGMLLVEDDQIQYRSFTHGDQMQGEIQGKHARHGKVGFGTINDALRKLTGNEVTKRVDIVALLKTPKGKRGIIDSILTMAAVVLGETLTQTMRRKIIAMADTVDDDYLCSKYQAVELLYYVDQFRAKHPRQAHKFVNELFAYAASTTDVSSVFVKVS